jgi:surface antigen
MKNLFQIVATVVLMCVMSVAAYASNFNFLSNSAMSFFTKEDWNISKTAEVKALNQNQDGVKLAWTNPRTGSHGIFVPTHTFHAHGSVCRDLSIMHTANMVNEKAIYRYCKLNDEWKIV